MFRFLTTPFEINILMTCTFKINSNETFVFFFSNRIITSYHKAPENKMINFKRPTIRNSLLRFSFISILKPMNGLDI